MGTTESDTRSEVLSVLRTIAPEIETSALRDDVPLRDQVDLDSMDWLNFLVGVDRRLHVTVDERDYSSLRTLSDLVSYLEIRSPSARDR